MKKVVLLRILAPKKANSSFKARLLSLCCFLPIDKLRALVYTFSKLAIQ